MRTIDHEPEARRVDLGGPSGGEQCERHAVLLDGTEVFCGKSFGHDVVYRPDSPRRLHFDVSEDREWSPEEERKVITS